jgi:hypothetical protein
MNKHENKNEVSATGMKKPYEPAVINFPYQKKNTEISGVYFRSIIKSEQQTAYHLNCYP